MDRFISHLVVDQEVAPCFVALALTVTLMAAKIEDFKQPSFNRMIKLLKSQHDMELSKQELVNLEERLIRKLDFNIREVYSITFLERFFRLFIANQEKNDRNVDQIVKLSYEYCKYMQL